MRPREVSMSKEGACRSKNTSGRELCSACNGSVRDHERQRWLSLDVAMMKAHEGSREVRQTWWYA
jgi:hypothetical protein